MSRASFYIELSCGACGWAEQCSPVRAGEWLARAGRPRKAGLPETPILHELLRAAAPALVCPACGGAGLSSRPVADEFDLPGERPCEACGQAIPAERVAALPKVTLCAKCAGAVERGGTPGPAEYCPRCGSLMELRPSRGAGITRYELRCTAGARCGR
jgi:ssDNA-binding Zn-finger/Zn-ribbon topoisomerase 1